MNAAKIPSVETESGLGIGARFRGGLDSRKSHCRGVAQPGSAPALGAGGREFESRRPDQFFERDSGEQELS
jgi:hypothetical protein